MAGSIHDILSQIDALASRFESADGSMRSVIEGGSSPTVEQVQGLRAEVAALQVDLRAVRRELDAVDAADFLLVVDGARTIALWDWQRQTRRTLARVASGLLDLQRMAARFAEGDSRKVVIAQDGDTLQTVAARELGDWRAWPDLLAANPGVPIGALPGGTALVIP